MATRQEDFITESRALARDLWNATNGLKTLQAEWNALDYGKTLPDGIGANGGVTAVEVGAVVFDTANAVLTVFGQGHATNLAKLL